MFSTIFKFFTNYFLLFFVVIGVGMVGLGAVVNSVLNWSWIIYFFVIFKSLISLIWFLPFDIIFTLLGLSLTLYAGLWGFRVAVLVYDFFHFSRK
jgi:hypothetical protein